MRRPPPSAGAPPTPRPALGARSGQARPLRRTPRALVRPPRQPHTIPRAADDTAVFTQLVAADGYDIRLLDAHAAVETAYENRGDGIERLARYFDGTNADGVRYASTQPLFMWHGGPSKLMRLRVGRPADGSSPSPGPPPAPLSDAGVSLTVAGGHAVAVITVPEQNVTPSVAASYLAALQAALARDGVSVSDPGVFGVAQYGPLYSLADRHNEILVQVAV